MVDRSRGQDVLRKETANPRIFGSQGAWAELWTAVVTVDVHCGISSSLSYSLVHFPVEQIT